jgi:hypothetical protein
MPFAIIIPKCASGPRIMNPHLQLIWFTSGLDFQTSAWLNTKTAELGKVKEVAFY